MSARRTSLIVFVAELVLLALPGTVLFAVSGASLATLMGDFEVVLGMIGDKSGPSGPPMLPLAIFGAYALTFTSFWVLAWRYVAGGGDRVRRVGIVIWGLALTGQAVAVGSVLATALTDSEAAPIVAVLTYPALGLLVPLVHMFVAAWRASEAAEPSAPTLA